MSGGGYQSVPSVDVDCCVESGGGGPSEDHVGAPSRPLSAASLTEQSSAIKLSYIALGVIIGCIGSRGLFGRSGVTLVDDTNVQTLGASNQLLQPVNGPQGYLINGKSFLDSLPFENVMPPSRMSAEEGAASISSSLENSVSNALSTIKDSASAISASLLGASTPSPPSTPSNSAPHLLYHAHQSAFGLLYDSTKYTNNYLSEYSLDYFLINSGGFDAQINQAYCGVASVVTLLNSLKYAKRFREAGDLSGWSFDLPVDPRYRPYPYATQRDVLVGDCVNDNVIGYSETFDGIFAPPYGLALEQAGKLLRCHTSDSEWEVTVHEVDPSRGDTLSRMRYELKAALIDPDARVMINYDRKGLGQVGGGHFSPLGSYHANTDSFLVVDVAKYKYPPVWVGADTLFHSMATVDKCGTWDYPMGQERLVNGTASGGGRVFNPETPADYAASLSVLNCKQRNRGYVILKKKGLA